MTSWPTWEQIPLQKDQECAYLLRWCMQAEGYDLGDTYSLVALISDAERSSRG